MIKRIPLSAVRPGMVVNRLDGHWLSHPFYRTRFRIETPEDLARVRALDQDTIEIDTADGLDVDGAPAEAEAGAQAVTEVALQAAAVPSPRVSTSVQAELGYARSVHRAANDLMRRTLQNARNGELPELGPIEDLVERMSQTLARNPGALLSLCRIRSADEYTFRHSVNVGAMMTGFCAFLGMDSDMVRRGGLGGMLHDIGKTQMPLKVLNKPGKLNAEEMVIMRRHPGDGHAILSGIDGIHEVQLDIALQHHERINGFGYPQALPEDKIAYMAKVAAVVDVYDALTAERCYHGALTPYEALRKLLAATTTDFDQRLVCEFIRFVGVYPVGSTVALASGQIAIVVESSVEDRLRPVVLAVYDVNRQRPIDGRRIDLSVPPGDGERIVGAVQPEAYSIDPLYYL